MFNFTPHNGRTLDPARPVRIYRNLNKPGTVYSLQQGGRVVGYTSEITLQQCRCHVSETGRRRVVENRRREVHAWIEGTPTAEPLQPAAMLSYNPYKAPHFYNVETAAAIHSAAAMRFTGAGVFVQP